MNNILFENIEIGQGVYISKTAKIQGVNGKGKSIRIGDHAFIGENVYIMVDEFSIGDYARIHHDTNIHGYQPCMIGHNFWCGQFTIIDSIGGVNIGNNVGIGAHSQLWSHIKYGDTLNGCRWNSHKSLKIGNDVWFVGHTIVSPITAEDKSMALVGSVVTRDMAYNRVYSGVPAGLHLDRNGRPCEQFIDRLTIDKQKDMRRYLKESGVDETRIEIMNHPDYLVDEDPRVSYFFVESRQYTKRGTIDEVQFMKYLLPERAKFVPL